jgi:hypothetical protein
MSAGKVDLTKLYDCIRLVRSTAPRQDLANVMLAAIERVPGAPTRAEILEAMRKENEDAKK